MFEQNEEKLLGTIVDMVAEFDASVKLEESEWISDMVIEVVNRLCALAFVSGATPWEVSDNMFTAPMRESDLIAQRFNNRGEGLTIQRWRDYRNVIANRLAEREGSSG